MKDRALYRLLAVELLDDFREMIDELKQSYQIKSTIENIESIPDQYKGLIAGPIMPRNFEYVIHSNIIIKSVYFDGYEETQLQNNPDSINWDNVDIKIESVEVDWNKVIDTFKERLNGELERLLDKSLITKDSYLYFYKYRIYVLDLIKLLLENSWKVILKYFPLEEYGLPSRKLFEAIMNYIIGDKVNLEEIEPYAYADNDVYGLIIRQENEYLRSKLEELGVDVDKEMVEDGFVDRRLMLEKVINRNPVYSIIIYPTINTTSLTKTSPSLIKSLKKLNDDLMPHAYETSNKFQTIKDYAELYIDKRFNKKMSYSRIRDELDKELGIKKNEKDIADEIKILVEATGLVEQEKSIERYSDYIRRI